MKTDKARLPELEIIYLELKMKVSRSAAIESPVRKQQGVKKLKCKSWQISLRRRKLRVVFLPCEMNHALKKNRYADYAIAISLCIKVKDQLDQ